MVIFATPNETTLGELNGGKPSLGLSDKTCCFFVPDRVKKTELSSYSPNRVQSPL
jgi:hypothetical protein